MAHVTQDPEEGYINNVGMICFDVDFGNKRIDISRGPSEVIRLDKNDLITLKALIKSVLYGTDDKR